MKQLVALFVFVIVACVVAFVGIVWSLDRSETRDTRLSETKGEPMFTPEDYRKALIDMVSQSEEPLLEMALPNLRNDPIVKHGNERIEIGRWDCDIAKGTFKIAGGDAIYIEFSGVFEKAPDGKLIAILQKKNLGSPRH